MDRLNSDIHEVRVINNAWLKKAIEKFNNQVPETDLSYLSNLLNHLIESLKYKKAKEIIDGPNNKSNLRIIDKRELFTLIRGTKSNP